MTPDLETGEGRFCVRGTSGKSVFFILACRSLQAAAPTGPQVKTQTMVNRDGYGEDMEKRMEKKGVNGLL